MEFYFVIISLSCIFFYWANKYFHQKAIFFSFFTLFLLIPSVVGGFRDLTIGSDLQGYGIIYFENAKYSTSIISFIKNIYGTEYGYHILNYLCSRISNDIHLFLFISEFIKILLVGLTAIHFRKVLNPNLLIIGYMLFFYWYGFSLMRQTLALCIILYSFTFYFSKKYIPFIITIIIAYLFHNSAVFALIICFIHILYNISSKPFLTLIIGVFIIYLSAIQLFIFIANSGLFAEEKGELYLDSGVPSAKTNILIALGFIITTYIFQNKKLTDQEKYLIYMVRANSLVCLMFLMLSSLFEVAFRVSFYPMMVLFIVYLSYIQTLNYKKKRLLIFLYLAMFLLHIYIAAEHGLGGTLPYKSSILNL